MAIGLPCSRGVEVWIKGEALVLPALPLATRTADFRVLEIAARFGNDLETILEVSSEITGISIGTTSSDSEFPNVHDQLPDPIGNRMKLPGQRILARAFTGNVERMACHQIATKARGANLSLHSRVRGSCIRHFTPNIACAVITPCPP